MTTSAGGGSEGVAAGAPLAWVDGRVLQGANAFANTTVVVATLRCGADAAVPAGLAERLVTSLPPLQRLLGEALGTGELRGGVAIARLVALLAQGLQRRVDCRSERIAATPGPEEGTFHAAAVSEVPDIGMLALALATRFVADAWAPAAPNHVPPMQILRFFEQSASGHLLSPVRRAIARTARARGIHCERINASYLRLGTGRMQQRCDMFNSSMNPMIHANMTFNKPLSNMNQRRMGVPVPRQITASSADAAVEAATAIGYPVVVKPCRGRQGKGVAANLVSEAEVRAAYDRATKVSEGTEVAVEEFLPGEDYRLLFIEGRFVAAAKRHPPQVVGDGTHTVAELVEEVNRTRDRPGGFGTTLHEYHVDEDSLRLLRGVGLTPESIPEAGRKVLLSSVANGGTTSDVTSSLHPDNIAAGSRATRVAGIPVCGVDFLLPDPARSYKETGGGICEVNYNPSAEIHIVADGGTDFAVVETFVDWLIPPPERGRIPVGFLFGVPPGVDAIVRRMLGEGVATCTPRGSSFDEHVLVAPPAAWPESGRMAVLEPDARHALLEVRGDDIARHGLYTEWCDVAALGDPSLAIDEGQKVALRVAATTVAWTAALAALPDKTRANPRSVVACATRHDDPALAAHLQGGGRAVVAEGGVVALLEGGLDRRESPLHARDRARARGGGARGGRRVGAPADSEAIARVFPEAITAPRP